MEVAGEVWWWRGPAPWHFVTVADPQAAELEAASSMVTYGWGMIPVTARLGRTTWETSLWPKDGEYVIPLKTAIRKAEQVELGDVVKVRLTIDL